MSSSLLLSPSFSISLSLSLAVSTDHYKSRGWRLINLPAEELPECVELLSGGITTAGNRNTCLILVGLLLVASAEIN